MAPPSRAVGPYLALNKQGVYEIRWSEGGRSFRRSTRETDSRLAQTVLAHFILVKDTVVPPRSRDGGDRYVATLLYAYEMERGPHLAAQDTLTQMARHLTEGFGAMLPLDITDKVVDDYCEKRRTGKIGVRAGNGTLRRELGILKTTLNYAVDQRKIGISDIPVDARTGKMRVKMPPEPEPQGRFLEPAEAQRLMDAVIASGSRRLKLYCILGFETASRPTALTTIRWEQMLMDQRLVQLNPTGRVQTKKHRPTIRMSDALHEALTEELRWLRQPHKDEVEGDEVARMKRLSRPKPTDFVLQHPGPIRKSFVAVAKRAGLKGVTPYALRHTWATWAMRERMDPWLMAQIMGDKLETVLKYYAHHSPDYQGGADVVNFRKPISFARPVALKVV